MEEYKLMIMGKSGSLVNTPWFKTDQSLSQMEVRVAEFVNMLKNHCYQLTVDGQFVGNWREYKNLEGFVKDHHPTGHKVVIECFPTSPQVCFDDATPQTQSRHS